MFSMLLLSCWPGQLSVKFTAKLLHCRSRLLAYLYK